MRSGTEDEDDISERGLNEKLAKQSDDSENEDDKKTNICEVDCETIVLKPLYSDKNVKCD